MLYNGENPIIRIVGIERMCFGESVQRVAPRNCSALSFRLCGEAKICYNERECIIGTSDVLYLPQDIGYTTEHTDTEIIVIHFITESADSEIEVYKVGNREELQKLFLRAYYIWQNKEPGYNVSSIAIFYKILEVIFKTETKSAMPKHFLDALSFINENYKKGNITITEVCKYVGISETQLRRLFTKYYFKTPLEYITELKLEYARNLISSGVKIEAAAYESGFNDAKYFARVVKKHFGCTPRQLKNYGK